MEEIRAHRGLELGSWSQGERGTRRDKTEFVTALLNINFTIQICFFELLY